MIATAATQAGIWAQYLASYSPFLLPSGSAVGATTFPTLTGLGTEQWSVPVTAPNGLVYLFGCNNQAKDYVVVGKLGKPNEKTKWFTVYTNASLNRPTLPGWIDLNPGTNSAQAGCQRSYKAFDARPVLAPNGLMYLFPEANPTGSSLVVFNPNAGYSTGLTTASGQGTISGRVLTITSVASGTYGIGQTISFTDPVTSNTVTRTIVFVDPGTASFTGSISGTTLTVSAVASGSIFVDATISGSGITPGTTITALGTGIGGTGTYIVSTPQTVTSTAITTSSLATTGTGGVGTYRLDSAVPNNVTVATTISGGEFPTCTWETETFASIAATKFSPAINPTTQQPLIVARNLRAPVLAKDGYLYCMPGAATSGVAGGILVRIAPRNTSINPSSTDRWEMHGFYNGVTATFINGVAATSTSRFFTPTDDTGSPLSKVAPYPTTNATFWWTRLRGQFLSYIHSGILHPNGKIYLFGMSRWVFILDPSKWSLGDANVIYSKNSLALRSDIADYTAVTGFRTAMIEKPISEYIAKVTEATSYTSGATVTIKVSDSNYIYPGMTVTVYSGQGSFTNPSNVIVESVDKINNTFVAKDTTAGNVLQQNFQVNDLIRVSPTQQMLDNVKIIMYPGFSGTGSTTPNSLFRPYIIDTTTDTIYPYGPSLTVGNQGSWPNVNPAPTIVPNGLIFGMTLATSASSPFTFTGSDYPITNAADPNNPKVTSGGYGGNFNKNNSIIPGWIGTSSFFANSYSSNLLTGGSTFGISQSIGKIIYPSCGAQVTAPTTSIAGEMVSIKGYSAFTRYFNYAPSDRLVYEPPADLYNDLATSSYNCYVNRCY